jgi:hypothetical protein
MVMVCSSDGINPTTKQNMKSRINWSAITNLSRRAELKKLAAKMKRKGFARIQLNHHGVGQFSIDGFNAQGGVWIA